VKFTQTLNLLEKFIEFVNMLYQQESGWPKEVAKPLVVCPQEFK
jgi:hypothetical protein